MASTQKNSAYNPNIDWAYGCQFNAYYVFEEQVGAWEETRKINDSSVPSVLLGFVLDREPIKNELAAVAAAAKEFSDMNFGIMDYDKVEPYRQDQGCWRREGAGRGDQAAPGLERAG